MIESFSLSALLRSLGLSGMISIALAAALAFVVWRADAISSRAEALEADLSAEQTAHEITAASLNEAEGRLSLYIEDGKRREKAAAEAQERQQAISAGLTLEIERIRAERAGDSKSGADSGQCVTSAAVMQAKGL